MNMQLVKSDFPSSKFDLKWCSFAVFQVGSYKFNSLPSDVTLWQLISAYTVLMVRQIKSHAYNANIIYAYCTHTVAAHTQKYVLVFTHMLWNIAS